MKPFYSWQLLFITIYIIAKLDESVINDKVLVFFAIMIMLFTFLNFGIELGVFDKKRVILIGTDAPSLTTDHIETSITELNNNDMVLAPAEDGGYVLIGMSQHNHSIFQSINWGSDSVLEATRDKISKNKLTSYELESCWDIDRVEDYQRYKKSLFNHL